MLCINKIYGTTLYFMMFNYSERNISAADFIKAISFAI